MDKIIRPTGQPSHKQGTSQQKTFQQNVNEMICVQSIRFAC